MSTVSSSAVGSTPTVLHLCSTTVGSHYFANLGRGLAERGFAPIFGSVAPDTEPAWVATAVGARHFSLGSHRWSAVAGIKLAVRLRRERVDVVQTHLFHAALMGTFAAALSGTSTVFVTRHHTDEIRLIGTRAHVLADQWVTRRATGVIGLSRAVCKYVTDVERVPKHRVHFVPQGFDFEALKPSESGRERVRSALGMRNAFVIGCLARFFPTKGHSFLLEAFSKLQKHIPESRLLLVGGGDRHSAVETALALGIADRVVFAGFRSDVPDCLAAMDVVVHPSETEAFCQAIVEAMAAGKPVVATDVAAASEVIENGTTGLLIPPRDPEAIVHAVMTLYGAPERIASIAASAEKSVRARFGISRMIDAQIALYEAAYRRGE